MFRKKVSIIKVTRKSKCLQQSMIFLMTTRMMTTRIFGHGNCFSINMGISLPALIKDYEQTSGFELL